MLKNAKRGICILLVLLMAIGFNSSSSEAAMTTPKQCIIINTKTNKLAYYKSGKLVKEFKVATGKSSTPTPTGKSKIVNKIKNRPYYKLGIPGGSSRNPLGDRWLGLQLRGTYGTTYAIHGNNNPSSIGKNISAGCVRMYNDDVRWLYNQISVGATVLIAKSSKSNVDIAKGYNINLQGSSTSGTSKTLTNNLYRYEAGDGKYLTYINGYGYSQYSHLSKDRSYALVTNNCMKRAGLEVTMPSSKNGYKMTINNPYINLSSNLEKVLDKAKNGELTSEQIQMELDKTKTIKYRDDYSAPKVSSKKNLIKNLNRYDAGKGKYLTTVKGTKYSRYSYLNTKGTTAFAKSNWLKKAGLEISMPTAKNGYVMKINNPYVKKYNNTIKELKEYI